MATGKSTHPGTGDGSAAVDQLNDTDPGRWQAATHTANTSSTSTIAPCSASPAPVVKTDSTQPATRCT